MGTIFGHFPGIISVLFSYVFDGHLVETFGGFGPLWVSILGRFCDFLWMSGSSENSAPACTGVTFPRFGRAKNSIFLDKIFWRQFMGPFPGFREPLGVTRVPFWIHLQPHFVGLKESYFPGVHGRL